MSYYIVGIALGSTLLTLSVGLMLWTKVRVVRLRVDLLSIRIELRKRVSDLGKLDDENYRKLDEVISSVVEQADLFTTSGYVYALISDKRLSENEDPFGDVDDAALRSVLRHSMLKLSARLMFYISSETASGLCISVLPLATIGMIVGVLAIVRSVPLIWGTFKPDGDITHHKIHVGA